jgi:hypothetical protein
MLQCLTPADLCALRYLQLLNSGKRCSTAYTAGTAAQATLAPTADTERLLHEHSIESYLSMLQTSRMNMTTSPYTAA